jgi:K+-transporting ATPase c subunit
MLGHLRASLLLLVLTVLVCCVLYPLIVWGIGQAFPEQAKGSLILKDGKPVGSRLIAQAFTGDGYFWPRPSFAGSSGYDASASGASNWGASNPKLRDRVARALGPIVRYASGPRKGELVGPDIEKWVQENPDLKKDALTLTGRDLQAAFFDRWLQAHPEADLEKVPADLVMASGSGLDPHITCRNALYQAPRVAKARGRTLQEIEQLVEEMAQPLMGGLAIAGPENLVNVLELNLALDAHLPASGRLER